MNSKRNLVLWVVGALIGLFSTLLLISPYIEVSNAQVSSDHDDSAELIGYKPHTIFVLNNDPTGYDLKAVDQPVSGVARVLEDVIVYTAPDGFEGEDSFRYRAENSEGDVIEPTVRLGIVPGTMGARIKERLARDPAFVVDFSQNLIEQIKADPDGPLAKSIGTSINQRIDTDPRFARWFRAILGASLNKRPIDLYVLIGDDNLQGMTQSGDINGPDVSFAQELDRLWDQAPDESNASSILVLNCAMAGTVLPQWSGLDAPRSGLPGWIDNSHGALLSARCMADIDGMLRNTRLPVVLRGIVISAGANDARLSGSQPGLVSHWNSNLLQTIDLYRAAYGTDFGVLLVRLPGAGSDLPYARAWQEIRRAQSDYIYYNTALVDTDGIDLWTAPGALPLFSDIGQQELARRLAAAAYELWHRVFYDLQDQQPVLGATGECSRQTPCFPNTPYLIEPQLCDERHFFRRSREKKQVICDQAGHSLHALAAACNHCVDMKHVAGNLGVGMLKLKTGQHFGSTYYMPQFVEGKLIEPLPYQNRYTVGEPRPCGYQDRESSTFVLDPGSYDYILQARQVEYCSKSDTTGCGPLLSPQTVLADKWSQTVEVTSGECRELLAQHSDGESLTCGQEITRDTVLGHDLHCDFDEGIGLFIRGSDLILDLNGHTLSGTTDASDDTQGLLIHESSNVTVTNGVIEGFASAISIVNESTGIDINRLTLRELDAEGEEHHIRGISTTNGIRDVTIRDLLIEMIPKFHADGVGLDDSINVVARNVKQIGGASMFAVGPYECDHDTKPITFEIHDSIALASYLSAVFLQCTTSARVAGNEFRPLWNHAAGVTAHAGKPGSVKALEITDNFFHGGMIGVDFAGIDDSLVSQNYVTDSYLYGIAMNHSLLCAHQEAPGSHPLPKWFECFGASGNLIEKNWVTSKSQSSALKPKGTDLYESPRAHDNSWVDNVCDTTVGKTVPPCLATP